MKLKNLFVVIFLISTQTVNAQGTFITFKSKVSDTRLSAKFVEKGKSLESTVSVTEKALIYNPPVVIDFLEKSDSNLHPLVDKTVSYYNALVNEEASDILTYWHPDEREGKSELIGNPNTLERPKKYFRKNSKLKIIGIILHEQTPSVILDMGNRINSFSYKLMQDKFFVTDKPQNDLELSIIEASFH